MQFSVTTSTLDKPRAGIRAAGIYHKRKPAAGASTLDAARDGEIAALLKAGEMDGEAGSRLLLPGGGTPGNQGKGSALLIGLGAKKDFDARAARKAAQALAAALVERPATSAAIAVADFQPRGKDIAWVVHTLVAAISEAAYRFTPFKGKEKTTPVKLDKIQLCVERKDAEAAKQACTEAAAIATGVNRAKDLGNTPPNVCYPESLAETARELARQHKQLKATVLDEKDLEKLGAGAILAVGKGSERPPRLIAMEYSGGKKGDAPVVLVGKGITFDTGGISLKPGAEMDEMKYDMCGAASVFGVIEACCELGLPINVVGVVTSAENMPDGRATRPGDIVTTLSGQTVEILNTDAEGRLVLADALTWVERYKPKAVIDIATLTGACIIALGHQGAAILGNKEPLIKRLLAAGEETGDRGWQLPLWPEYQEQLKSNFADMANIGGRPAGTITAACFLSRYTEDYTWAHVDIAGVAWKSGKEKGATGRPVPMLMRYLLDQA
ncbi:leucyl aminopeptidase [Thioalkalivibrio sp. ALJ16]|uniref:leucyl aminopeptidase n=1 Tax=Thioalkalivibrio sp. ALJ16 TaxID=1158762 RepID=UPI00037B919A|nr:leucyl aminopeptidase [Thioalkalivibrio sp. ALJ16]